MSPFHALLILFAALHLFAGNIAARPVPVTFNSDDGTIIEYWKSSTKDQPLPEALRNLIPSEIDTEVENFENDPNALLPYLSQKDNHFHISFESEPNAYLSQNDDVNFENDPNALLPYLSQKDNHLYKKFENDPNALLPYLSQKDDQLPGDAENDPNARLPHINHKDRNSQEEA